MGHSVVAVPCALCEMFVGCAAVAAAKECWHGAAEAAEAVAGDVDVGSGEGVVDVGEEECREKKCVEW